MSTVDATLSALDEIEGQLQRQEHAARMKAYRAYLALVTRISDGESVDIDALRKTMREAGVEPLQIREDCRLLQDRRQLAEKLQTALLHEQELPVKQAELEALQAEWKAELQKLKDKYETRDRELIQRVQFLSTCASSRTVADQLVQTCWPPERHALEEWERRYEPLLAEYRSVRNHAQETGHTPALGERMKQLDDQLEALRAERETIVELCLKP